MPIIQIRSLPRAEPFDTSVALARICRELASAIGVEEPEVWATWETLPAGRYVEGSAAPVEQPRETHPPLVRIQAAGGRSPEEIARVLRVVGDAVAATMGIEPGNVFVHYEELGAGRVFTGGEILR